jgi:hypothetical protein
MQDSIATPAKMESAQPDFSHGLQDFCNTRKHLLNKENTRFLTLARVKVFGGATAFHITRLCESDRTLRAHKHVKMLSDCRTHRHQHGLAGR